MLIPADDTCEETDVYIEESGSEMTDHYEESLDRSDQETDTSVKLSGGDECNFMYSSTELYPCSPYRKAALKLTLAIPPLITKLSIKKKKRQHRRNRAKHFVNNVLC